MAKNDFKNAAAKLLAQHAKINPKSSASTVAKEIKPVPIVSQPVRSSVTAVYLPEPPEEDYAVYQPEPQGRVKVYLLFGLALLGCSIMVFLVPETIFGLTGNAVVGAVFGAGLGWLINREF